MRATILEPRTGQLPVTRDLTLAFAGSLTIALIMAGAAAAGLTFRTQLYPTEGVFLSFVPSDAFNLAVGVPVLLASMCQAQRGRLIGLLCWPGALFYVLYITIPYLIAVPFNVLFLPYLALVTLSAFTLIGLISSIDWEAVRQQLEGFVPGRASAGILIGLALLIVARQMALVITALATQAPVDDMEVATWIADFAVAVPQLLAGGILLWQRRPLGYVAGAGLLLGYAILALSVIPFLVFQPRYSDSPLDVAGIVAILIMAVLCLVPFAFFVRAAAPDRAITSRS